MHLALRTRCFYAAYDEQQAVSALDQKSTTVQPYLLSTNPDLAFGQPQWAFLALLPRTSAERPKEYEHT